MHAEEEYKFVKRIVDLANKTQSHLDGSFSVVETMIAEAELVLALWQAPLTKFGLDYIVIKGERILAESVDSNVNLTAKTRVVPCVCAEQAYALKQVAGEKSWRH